MQPVSQASSDVYGHPEQAVPRLPVSSSGTFSPRYWLPPAPASGTYGSVNPFAPAPCAPYSLPQSSTSALGQELLDSIAAAHSSAVKQVLAGAARYGTRLDLDSLRNSQGLPAIYLACLAPSAQAAEMLQILLGHGANPNTACTDGCTALHHAAENNKIEALNALLAHPRIVVDAPTTAGSVYGFTPLYYAVQNNAEYAVHLLLGHRANPNVGLSDRFTPLHRACDRGYLNAQGVASIVQMLMRAGADPMASTNNGQRPGDFATDHVRHYLYSSAPQPALWPNQSLI